MTQLAFDVYPASNPRDGARLVRLTNQDYLAGTGYQAQRRGAGAGTIVLSALHAAVAAGYLAEGNYVRVVDLDLGASGEVIGGIWLNEGEVVVLSKDEDGGKVFTIGGQGTLYYLHLATISSVARSPDGGPEDQFNIDTYGKWRWGVKADGTPNGETFGGILRRVIVEAWLDVPSGISALATSLSDLSTHLTFADINDSNVSPWPSTNGLYEIPVGDNLLDTIATLMGFGIDIYMDPDTFRIDAFIADTDGVVRTGTAFGAGVVRFEGGVNIAADLTKAIHESVRVTHMLVIGNDGITFANVIDPAWVSGQPVVHGSMRMDSTSDTASMQLAGAQQIAARKLQTDQATFPHVPGNAPLSGSYTPGKVNGHYWVGDTVTLHTGTGAHDYNNQAIQVAAISYILRDAGDWDVQPQLGSSYLSFGGGTTFSTAGSALCDCGMLLCDVPAPAVAPTVVEGWPSGAGGVSSSAAAIRDGDLLSGDGTGYYIARLRGGGGAVWMAWTDPVEITSYIMHQGFSPEDAQYGSTAFVRAGWRLEVSNDPVTTGPAAVVYTEVENAESSASVQDSTHALAAGAWRWWRWRSSVQDAPGALQNDWLIREIEITVVGSRADPLAGTSPKAARCDHQTHASDVIFTDGTNLQTDWPSVVQGGTAAGGDLSGTYPNPTVAKIGGVAVAGDPLPQYQKESEKGSASGYAGLDAGAKVPTAQLGSGTADATTFLRGDQTYGVPSAAPTAAQVRDAGRWEPVIDADGSLVLDGATPPSCVMDWVTGA